MNLNNTKIGQAAINCTEPVTLNKTKECKFTDIIYCCHLKNLVGLRKVISTVKRQENLEFLKSSLNCVWYLFQHFLNMDPFKKLSVLPTRITSHWFLSYACQRQTTVAILIIMYF